jgi:hypothetical protein
MNKHGSVLRSWFLALSILTAIVWCSRALPARAGADSGAAASEATVIAADKAASPLSDVADGLIIPTRDLRRILQDAGPLMYAIVFCSFLLIAFFWSASSVCVAAA